MVKTLVTTAIRVGGLLRGTEFHPEKDKCIFIEEGILASIENPSMCPAHYEDFSQAILVPAPANSHTHLADFMIPEYGVDKSLHELVAPPKGLKHVLLSKADWREKINAYSRALNYIESTGVSLVIDYREEGGDGCKAARTAACQSFYKGSLILLGRPIGGEDLPPVIEYCDGLGLPSPINYSETVLKEIGRITREKDLIVSSHIAETRETREEGDLDYLLEYVDPTFIVHGTHLSQDDIALLSERRIPVAVCPRSTLFHSTGIPPLRHFYEGGLDIMIGSDNAAWQVPSVWRDLETVYLIGRYQGLRGSSFVSWILRGFFYNPYKYTGINPPVIDEGFKADYLLIDASSNGILDSQDMRVALVKRVDRKDIIRRVI